MSDIGSLLRVLSAGVIPVLLAITLHEVAHGWAARWHGDRTAELLGRLSLNPIRHIDPVGTVLVPILLMVFAGWAFGWAKPVPVNPNNLRDPKRDMVAVAAAGPAANLVMGFGWALVFAFALRVMGGTGTVAPFLIEMARIGIFFNCLLAIFNLIPLPPLDGGRVLRGLVPEGLGRRLDAIEPFGFIIIVLLLWANVIGPILWPPIIALQSLLYRLVGIGG